MRTRAYKLKAFTLIELLVVVSIIALLVSILVPALSRAREQAQTVLDQSRQKQLVTGVVLYTVENDGCFPPNYIDRDEDIDYRYFNMIAEYMDVKDHSRKDDGESARHGASDSELFRCTTQDYLTHALRDLSENEANWNTAFESPKTGYEYHGVGSQLGMYGYNRFLMGAPDDKYSKRFWKMGNVRQPASFPVFSCVNVELGGYGHLADVDGVKPMNPGDGSGGVLKFLPNPIAIDYGWPEPGRGRPRVSWNGPAPMHNGRILYAVGDGSVQTYSNLWPFDADNPNEDYSRYFHPRRHTID